MLGLALEGGGARGAFHIGAVKALLERGYVFDGAVGTSIGAFNAALISQKDFEKAYTLWLNMEPSTLFNIENEEMDKLNHLELNREILRLLSNKAKGVIEHKGIDTSKLMRVLEEMIDEDKLRSSNLDFGIVTVSVPDFKPLEWYKEDIPEGKINDYIMASCNFPGFKLYPIDGKYYIDGGVHDNCPVNLLIRKGYKEIIAIRTSKNAKFTKLEDKNVHIIPIIPSENLGGVLIFDNGLIRRNIEMGYYDTIRTIDHLKGKRYCIKPVNEKMFFNLISHLSAEVVFQLGNLLKLRHMNSQRMVFEKIMPKLADLLKMPQSASYQDIIIGILEVAATKRDINRFKIYTLEEFLKILMEHKLSISYKREENIMPIRTLSISNNLLEEMSEIILEAINDICLKK